MEDFKAFKLSVQQLAHMNTHYISYKKTLKGRSKGRSKGRLAANFAEFYQNKQLLKVAGAGELSLSDLDSDKDTSSTTKVYSLLQTCRKVLPDDKPSEVESLASEDLNPVASMLDCSGLENVLLVALRLDFLTDEKLS